ncbi:dentin sialophosphoprotein isoform X2 [Ceratitis capitata]|uniref:(Mediterranean fruit fly) hypothetical protein n=1 Tax=Ceratitis capitata TaxID=7213 RepID=A0A811U2E4_CERCA|nr:dentin sialophosphoprotein isoform X2 [Ceratitis capitata]CAD6992538.1 unnamed protein product [Ceratitis capitata]
MSDDDSKNLPHVYENLPTVSGNLTTNRGIGTDTSSSDISMGSIGKEDSTESKDPLISCVSKRKSDETSSSDSPASDSREVENSNEDLPMESPTDSIGRNNFNEDDANIKLPANKRVCHDNSTSDISTTDSIESKNAGETPTYANIPKGTCDTSDVSTVDSIESKNAVENPIYANIPISSSDTSGSNYVAIDKIKRKSTDKATTSREAKLSPKSTTDRILLAIKDISDSQKRVEERLSVIESSILINRELENEHYRNLEIDHTVIKRNQATLSAKMDNVGNSLTIIGDHLTLERNEF